MNSHEKHTTTHGPMTALLAVAMLLAAAVPGTAGEDEQSKEPAAEGSEEAVEVAAPADPAVPQDTEEPHRAPPERITVMDEGDLGPDMRAQSTALQGGELEEIKEISRHRGAYSQLFLFDTPWHGPMLFRPGIAVPLETRQGREKRQAAAAAARRAPPTPPARVPAEPAGPEEPE